MKRKMKKINFRKKHYFLSILILILFVPALGIELKVDSYDFNNKVSSTSFDSDLIKILAYNILDSGIAGEFLNVLKEENADILMLVETMNFAIDGNEQFDEVIAELNDYFPDEDPYQGVCYRWGDETLISRYPIIDSVQLGEYYLDNGELYSLYRDILHATIIIDSTEVHLFGVHFKCCEGTNEELSREQDMEAIINYMDDLGNVPIIYLGDFNCFSPIDVNTPYLAPNVPNLGFGPVDMLLNKSNEKSSSIHTWIDSYRELRPYDAGYSYIDAVYQSRIDFIFVNSFFEHKLINATVGDTASAVSGSDHFCVDLWITFNDLSNTYRLPYQVTGINGSIINSSSCQIDWEESTEVAIKDYIIYKNGIMLGNTSERNFIDSDLISGEFYEYNVAAVSIDGWKGLKSKPILVNTDGLVITKPNVPVLNGTAGDKYINLTWVIEEDQDIYPIEQVNLYLIEMENSSITNKTLLKTVDGSNYQLTELINGNEYFLAVTAVSTLGESDLSNVLTLIPIEITTEMTTIETSSSVISSSAPTTENPSTTTSGFHSDMIPFLILGYSLLHIIKRRKTNQR